jgi:methyl-accepting chemotaxis protein
MRLVLLLIALPAIGLTLILNGVFWDQTRKLGANETRLRGTSIAKELAVNVSLYMLDRAGVQGIAQKTLDQVDEDLVYVVVKDAKNEVIAEARKADLSKAAREELWESSGNAAEAAAQRRITGVNVVPISAPVFVEDLGSTDDLGILPGSEAAPEPKKAGGERKAVGKVLLGLRTDRIDREIFKASGFAFGITLAVLLGSLIVAIAVARRLVQRVERLAFGAAAIAGGDLGHQVVQEGSDEVGDLAKAFGTMGSALRTMVVDLRAAASDVEREASAILATSTEQSAMASQQASAINETSTTVTEIAQTSKQATEHADQVIKLAQRSEDLSREGQKVVEDAIGGMEKMAEQVKVIGAAVTDLRERTLQIGDIISTVKDLAEQSNLLALNASIEASKAGEHGRGFAVVAMEMRNLAEQSKAAAGQVRGILSEVQKGTRAAVAVTEEGSKRAHAAIGLAQSAGTSIMGLADVIRDSSVAARQIASNTRQQTIGVEQIVSAITELSSAMNDTLEGTKRIESVAGNLNTVSRRLTEIVGRYRT